MLLMFIYSQNQNMFDNFFDEPQEQIIERFSTLMLLLFVYYVVTYYGLLKYKCGATNLPSVTTIGMLMIMHVAQVMLLFHLHQLENMWMIIICAFGPVLLVMLYRKYNKRFSQYEEMSILSKLRQENNTNAMYQQHQQPVPNQHLPQPPPTHTQATQPQIHSASQSFLPPRTTPNLTLQQQPYKHDPTGLITDPYPNGGAPKPQSTNWDTYPGPPTEPVASTPYKNDPMPFHLSPF